MTDIPPGYKQTEVGVIPSDWKVNRIDDIAIKVGSGITPTGGERVYKKEGRPFIRSQNVGWGKLIIDDIVFIDESTHNSFNSTEIKKNDVLLNITGASIGRSAIANERIVRGNVNQHVSIIRGDTNIVESRYLCYFLLSGLGQKQINDFQAGGNRQGLNFGQIKSINIFLPPTKAEQTAIATALNDTDVLITQLEKLIAKKRNIKQGAMQELLKPKEEWTCTTVEKLGNPYGGLSGKSKNDFLDGNYPYIPFMNIMINPIINKNYLDYVKISPTEKQNRALKGDLFFNSSSETPEEVGMCSVLLNDIPNLYLNSFCFGFRLNKELNNNGLYLSYYFRSNYGRTIFYILAQGATRHNLSKSNFIKIEFQIPEPKEQTHIAKILTDMDTEIESLEKKLEKYKMIKQGMMQKLLTGKIRFV